MYLMHRHRDSDETRRRERANEGLDSIRTLEEKERA